MALIHGNEIVAEPLFGMAYGIYPFCVGEDTVRKCLPMSGVLEFTPGLQGHFAEHSRQQRRTNHTVLHWPPKVLNL